MTIAILSGVSTTVRYLTLATVMTGCTFASPAGSPEVIPPAPTPPAAQPCQTNEQGVVLCVDFEDRPLAGLATDRSPYGNHAVAVDVGSTQRLPDEQAALMRSTSSLRVPESAALDLAQFTIEMWIYPEKPPPKRADWGLFDNYGQYTMRIRDDLKIRCALLGDSRVSSDSAVPKQQWSHVACRYAAGELRVYINGHLSDCRTVPPIAVPGLFGSAIGAELRPNATLTAAAPVDRFIGGIDDVRVYDHPLDEDVLCAAAGQAPGSCATECPLSGDAGE